MGAESSQTVWGRGSGSWEDDALWRCSSPASWRRSSAASRAIVCLEGESFCCLCRYWPYYVTCVPVIRSNYLGSHPASERSRSALRQVNLGDGREYAVYAHVCGFAPVATNRANGRLGTLQRHRRAWPSGGLTLVADQYWYCLSPVAIRRPPGSPPKAQAPTSTMTPISCSVP
jgi:hypothetical protein